MPSALLLLGSPLPILFSVKRSLASPGFTWHQLHFLSINGVVGYFVQTQLDFLFPTSRGTDPQGLTYSLFAE